MPTGFSFSNTCTEFIINDEKWAFQGAYQAGTKYNPQFGDFRKFFYDYIDPENSCISIFHDGFKSGTLPDINDVYFYIALVKHYYQGLLKTSYVPLSILNSYYLLLVKTAVQNFGINTSVTGKSIQIPTSKKSLFENQFKVFKT